MSVIVTLRAKGDPAKLEEHAKANQEAIQGILERAKGHGVVAHRFYGADGQIMVIDEWPDPESFQAFFEESRSDIQPLMDEAGVTERPEVTFWHKLDTQDEFGWES